ncbi:MAG: hypothetical protein ABSH08_15895 [Tepidisphaeraceae bacterium]
MAADNGIGGTSMGTIVLDYAQPWDDQRRRVISWLEGAVLAGAGILLPLGCFAASLNRYPGGPDFQRGKWFDYLTLVPSVRASGPFAPLLFAATYAMAVLVIAPHRVVQSWLLRWALYSGTILAAQYTLIQAIAFAEPGALLSVGTIVAVGAAGIATLLALGGLWVIPRLPRIKPAYWLPCAILMPVAAVVGWRIALPVILLSAMLVAIVAPALTLAVYLRVSYIVWKLAQQEPRAGGRIGLRVPLAWLTTYGTAWVLAVIDAIDLYNSLPKTPPDC